MTLRIFLDASALFAAAYSPEGAARELLRLGLAGHVVLLTNQIAIEEVARNLTRKAPEGLVIFRTLLADLPIEILPTPAQAEVENLVAIVVAKDASILAGAVAARADFLATFDRQHLIGIHVDQVAPDLIIATPGDVLGLIRP
jgi:predicted nucleic acid-binding protein